FNGNAIRVVLRQKLKGALDVRRRIAVLPLEHQGPGKNSVRSARVWGELECKSALLNGKIKVARVEGSHCERVANHGGVRGELHGPSQAAHRLLTTIVMRQRNAQICKRPNGQRAQRDGRTVKTNGVRVVGGIEELCELEVRPVVSRVGGLHSAVER